MTSIAVIAVVAFNSARPPDVARKIYGNRCSQRERARKRYLIADNLRTWYAKSGSHPSTADKAVVVGAERASGQESNLSVLGIWYLGCQRLPKSWEKHRWGGEGPGDLLSVLVALASVFDVT